MVSASPETIGLDAQNDAAAFELDCERCACDLLAAMPKHPPGPGRSRPRSDPPRLADLGISSNQSSRWQAVARLPGRVWETARAEIGTHPGRDRRPTT